ncbi:MAG TPA: hypothetical protein DD381_08360 [Lentisphaeria bacterium]|nr:MAG: hypothetical protein A2X47_04920 [Lentisphaerae bacterium GWF2_38_69]HBM16335.1 hypothetical protein [Lentisphaeria bacterium]
MANERTKRLGLRASVIICFSLILISTIIFIGFISSTLVFKLGNISVSVAEKDITSEYLDYVKVLMDRKAKEYTHLIELGLKLSGIYASQIGFICDNASSFDFNETLLDKFRDNYLKDSSKDFYFHQNGGYAHALAGSKEDESLKKDLPLYYAISCFDPFMKTAISESRSFDYFSLLLFDTHYLTFFTKDKNFNMSVIDNADYLRKYIDKTYVDFSSRPGLLQEVNYRYKSLDTLGALTCTAKYFSKKDQKLILSSTIGIDKFNLTKDMEKEELLIIANWKGLDEESFARKYVFTFVYDEKSSEFVVFPEKARTLLGFVPNTKTVSKPDSDTNSVFEERLFTSESSNGQIKNLSLMIKKEKEGRFHVEINNMDYLLIYQKLDYADWILFTAIPYSILLNPAEEVKRNMLDIIYDFNFDFITMSVLFFLVIASVTIFLFRRYILYPIKGFNDRSIKMSQGNFGVSVIARGGRELYDLGRSFNQLSGELRRYMKNLEFEIKAQANLESEMDIARRIQESMLPSYDIMGDDKRYSIYCKLIPAKEVAGDFYDLMKIQDNKLIFLVADVSGKGISAAFFMSIAKSVIRNSCINEPENPALAMTTANKILSRYGTEMFVTVFLCYLDLDTGIIKYANAGHNEPLMISSTGSSRYFGKMNNAVAGFIEDLDFNMGDDVINPGETLLLYTDGITEATSPSDELFEDERLSEIAAINYDSKLESLVSELIHAVDVFDNGVQFDDITVLTIRRNQIQ